MKLHSLDCSEERGVELDFTRRTLRHCKARVYRVDLALMLMLTLPGVTGHAMRIVLGHVANIFLLMRPGLFILDRCYVDAIQFGA